MQNLFARFVSDESGATAIEYGLIAAIVGVGIIASLGTLKTALTTQRDFLARLGIVERASALAKANPGQVDAIAAALRRLTDVDEMGTLFKVFSATSGELEPIGFA